jgi:hypothetical protein
LQDVGLENTTYSMTSSATPTWNPGAGGPAAPTGRLPGTCTDRNITSWLGIEEIDVAPHE